MAQLVKRLPAMWETQVQSLGWEDPLEKERVIGPKVKLLSWPWFYHVLRALNMKGNGHVERLGIQERVNM